MKLHSIKFKISVAYTIVLGFLLIAFSVFLYYSLYNSLIEEMDGELKEKSQQIQSFINSFCVNYYMDSESQNEALSKAAELTINIDRLHENMPDNTNIKEEWLKLFDHLDLSEDLIYIYNLDNKEAIYTHSVDSEAGNLFSKNVEHKLSNKQYFTKIKIANEVYRAIQEPFYFKGKMALVIQIATSQKSAIALLDQRKNVLFIGIPVVVLLAVIIGSMLANQMIMPIINVANSAEQISYKDFSQRVRVKYKDEETNILVKAFNTMLDRLEKSFKHIGEFNAQVAHELKTPIAIIGGECEVALRKQQSEEEYRDAFKAIFKESQKMLKITEDLLLLAKLDYSPEIFTFEEFDLKIFIEEMFVKVEKLASGRSINLNLVLPERDARLKGDAVHLERLFLNIINNAIKFTPKGGNISMDVGVKDRNLMVKIKDTGIGISKEDLSKIFNQFFQVITPETQQADGNGLGLSIAQSIAKIHFGKIEAQSDIRSGTVFTVLLPIVLPTAKQFELKTAAV